MKTLLPFLFIIVFWACKNEQKTAVLPSQKVKKTILKYASGFSITDHGNYKTLTITSPWANAEKSYRYALIPEENLAKTTINASEYDHIITTPLKRVIATSTTHVAFMDALETESNLIGFPNTNYISSKQVRQLVDDKKITDLGNSSDLNTEVVLQLQPETVFAFSLNSANKSLETLKKSKIPVVYIGEWTEASPLAKAEWLKVFGVLFDKIHKADSIFNTIATNYNKAKQQAAQIKDPMPTVFSGAMYKDIWYLPSGTSSEAILFKDAHTNYLWKDTKGSGSLQLNFETVYNTAKSAQYWFNPFSMISFKELQNSNKHYTEFAPFKSKNIYSFANTKGATGGLLYYELGTLRPDIVLKDLIKICHPELLPEHNLFFYKKLN